MEIRLSFVGSSANANVFEDLQDWLRDEPDLRGRVRPEPRPASATELGGASEILVIALGSGGALSVLAASLKAWFAQPRRSDVVVRVTGAHGEAIEIDAKRVADAESLLSTVLTGIREMR